MIEKVMGYFLGYIDKSGLYVIKPRLEHASSFQNGYTLGEWVTAFNSNLTRIIITEGDKMIFALRNKLYYGYFIILFLSTL